MFYTVKQIIIFFTLMALCASSEALDNNLVIKTIDRNIKKFDDIADIGIKIRNLQTGKIIYERNAKRHYVFASSLKLISIVAMQEYFGADYLFTTKILKQDDNYYLDIGDPDFSTDDLDYLIKEIKNKGINKIDGNFYIIDQSFSLPSIPEGNMMIDQSYCYGSPLTKVHIDNNCIKFFAETSNKIGSQIIINNQSLAPYKILNTAVTIPSKKHDRINTYIKGNTVIIDGTLSKQDCRVTIGTVVNDNLNHVRLTLAKLLENNNIPVKGDILYQNAIKNAEIIAVSQKTFKQIAAKVLKESNNYLANYLLSVISSVYGNTNWKEAGALLKKLATDSLHVDLKDSEIFDASGLSRYNMLTVNQFDEFLTVVYKFSNWKNMLPMLAIPGENGTLENRCNKLKVFAKTGTMSGISSFVGYVFGKNGAVYSFVIVTNNYTGSKKHLMELEDAIVRSIAESGECHY